MNHIRKLKQNKKAKSKNTIGTIIFVVVALIIAAFIFGGYVDALWGVVIAIGIIAAIGVATFFALKYFDDLPDLITRSGE